MDWASISKTWPDGEAHGASLIKRAVIKAATQLVGTARREIAQSLKLNPEEILVEEDYNPSDFLNKATLQHKAPTRQL